MLPGYHCRSQWWNDTNDSWCWLIQRRPVTKSWINEWCWWWTADCRTDTKLFDCSRLNEQRMNEQGQGRPATVRLISDTNVSVLCVHLLTKSFHGPTQPLPHPIIFLMNFNYLKRDWKIAFKWLPLLDFCAFVDFGWIFPAYASKSKLIRYKLFTFYSLK